MSEQFNSLFLAIKKRAFSKKFNNLLYIIKIAVYKPFLQESLLSLPLSRQTFSNSRKKFRNSCFLRKLLKNVFETLQKRLSFSLKKCAIKKQKITLEFFLRKLVYVLVDIFSKQKQFVLEIIIFTGGCFGHFIYFIVCKKLLKKKQMPCESRVGENS